MSLASTPARSLAAVGRSAFGAPGLLDAVAAAGTILEAIRVTPLAVAEAAALAAESAARSRSVVGKLIAIVRDDSDGVASIAAIHSLAAIPGTTADRALAEVLASGHGSLPAHAAWTSGRRSPAPELLEPLVRIVTLGGLGGMHAQTTLAGWARTEPWLVAAAVRAGLGQVRDDEGRRRLVETLGLVPDEGVRSDLVAIAVDRNEADVVRIASIAPFGDPSRAAIPRRIAALGRADDRVAAAARLARSDRALRRPGPAGHPPWRRTGTNGSGPAGLHVAQVHLGARLDPGLLRSGMGDTGGVATLLVTLGTALAWTHGVSEITTIGRGTSDDVLETRGLSMGGHRFAGVPLEPEDGTAFADRWPARASAERGIRRIIGTHGRPDVIHLRMADAGTLAAADVAASLGIPTVFSLALDPHGLIGEREASGDLDRRTFGPEDARLHYWYRVNLVQRLIRQAEQVVLFPRERLIDQIRELVGIDITARPDRFTVVPEGIDTGRISRAIAERVDGAGPGRSGRGTSGRGGPTDSIGQPETAAVAALLDRLETLPVGRQGLPIVMSVGRLHELKGMVRLVEAFALHPALVARANLVIVGGDLDEPSAAEAIELAKIRAVLVAHPDLATAIILLGHRPNGEVAHLFAAVRLGVGRLIGPDGAYACASLKEEFGLAIVEALAAGLPVVAPRTGGPSTYVEDGRTGLLVDTSDPGALAHGVADALDLAVEPGRAARAAETIAARYDISSMARALADVYGRAADRRQRWLAS